MSSNSFFPENSDILTKPLNVQEAGKGTKISSINHWFYNTKCMPATQEIEKNF